jgi:hypothetical protein
MVLTQYETPTTVTIPTAFMPDWTLNTDTNCFYYISRIAGPATGSYIYYWNPSIGTTGTEVRNQSPSAPNNLNGDTGYWYPILVYANNTLYVITTSAIYYTVRTNVTTISNYGVLFTPTIPSGNRIENVGYNSSTNRLYVFYKNTTTNVANSTYEVFTFTSSTTGTSISYSNLTLTNGPSRTKEIKFDNNNNGYINIVNYSPATSYNGTGIYKMTFDTNGQINSFNRIIVNTNSPYNKDQSIVGLSVNTINNFIVTGIPNGSNYFYNAYSFDGTLISGGSNILNRTGGYFQFIASDNNFNMFFVPYGGVTAYILNRILCFKEDTQILTYDGYKLIQDLQKGDLVKTSQNGYKPIYKIGHSKIIQQSSEDRIKDQLYKCSTENFPEVFEDLVLTGCHCILVDKFKDEKEREEAKKINRVNANNDDDDYITENKYRLPACVDERTTVYEVEGEHTIYHFALENDDYYMNYGVYANGLLVESTSKRFMDETHMNEITPPPPLTDFGVL